MKRRILVVDDELAVLLTLKTVLEMHGFEVLTANSAAEAVAKLVPARDASRLVERALCRRAEERDGAGAHPLNRRAGGELFDIDAWVGR